MAVVISYARQDAAAVEALRRDIESAHRQVWIGLESGPDVEVGGLVVDEHHGGAGIGRLLMNEAETWARQQGCRRVRLRSNVVRTAAHEFYQRIAYTVCKTHYAFERILETPERTESAD